jgi:hypothetical protein
MMLNLECTEGKKTTQGFTNLIHCHIMMK